MSQYWQRNGQPVRRTNTVGIPTVSASPCSEWKISVILSRVVLTSALASGPRGATGYCSGMRFSRSAASLAESVPGNFLVTSVRVALAAGYCFWAYWV